MKSWRSVLNLRLLLTLFVAANAVHAAAEPVPFQRVVELALQHSTAIAVAAQDERRTYENYAEAKAAYVPAVTLGSGIGFSYGVPLSIAGSAPSIFNITSQQAIFSLAQRDYVRASQRDWESQRLDTKDKREQVIYDAAAAYIELDSLAQRSLALGEEKQAADRAIFIGQSRLKEGLDSPLDVKRAQLAAAKVELRLAEVAGATDILRERLARMTGLAAASIETVHDSIPKPPDVRQEDNLAAEAVNSSPVVSFAEKKAASAEFRARAEHRQLLPSIDLASQYAVLSRFNNYDEFYRKFQRNNLSVGFSIRVPFLNFAQRHHAEAADADAVKARKEVDTVKAQVSENTLKLQRSLRQLAAAAEVARLQFEVAQAAIDTTQVQVQNGQANSRDVEQARIDASDAQVGYLESTFTLVNTQLQLLRSVGTLQSWATGTASK